MKKKLLLILVLVGFAVMYACKDDSFPVPPATTEPKFSYTLDNNGFAPATATFTNETVIPSTADTVLYYWNFGDSTLSEEANPTHFYARPGVFNVSLVVVSASTNEINQYVQTIIVVDPNGSGTATYFTNGTTVYSGYLNDQPPVFISLYGGLSDSYGLAVDTVNNKLYVCDYNNEKITVSDLDGSNKTDFRVGAGTIDGAIIDYQTHTIYWDTDDGIKSADLTNPSTSQMDDVVTGQANNPEGLSIDAVNRKLYWNSYNENGGIWVKDLDVVGGETKIIPGVVGGGGGALVVVNDRIFYDDYDDANSEAVLKSANLNGTGVATVATGISRVVFGLDYDPLTNKIYWGDRTPGIIMRANLDGTNPEPWSTKAGSSPRGLRFGKVKH